MKTLRVFAMAAACMFPALSLALDMPSTDFFNEHGEIFKWFLAISIIILGFFIKKTLDYFKEDSDNQWKCIRSQDKRLSRLEVEHEMQHYGRRSHDFDHFEGMGDKQ